MKAVKSALKTFWTDEEGATAIEYALIAALIAMVVATTLGTLGGNMNNLFLKVTNCVANKVCS